MSLARGVPDGSRTGWADALNDLNVLARHAGRLTAGATWLALGVSMVWAIHVRLPDLERPGRNYDEGVYLQSLLLMRHGYRPVADIVATQGPFHLYLAYVSYALGGYTLQAARMGVVVASLVTILAVAWTSHRLAGRLAAVASTLALALSPTLLLLSRQALPEVLALAFVAPAVGAAVAAWQTDRHRWRVLAGLLLAAACLIKPLVAPAALPVIILGYRRRSALASLLSPTVAGLAGLAGLALVGAGSTFEQVIGWRLRAQQLDPSWPIVSHNAGLLLDKLSGREGAALYTLGGLGAVLLVITSGRLALALVGWLVVQLGLLLCYANLSAHLDVALLPAVTLLVGVAVAGLGRPTTWTARLSPVGVLALGGTLWLLATTPTLVGRDQEIVAGRGSTDETIGQIERTVVREIDRLSTQDEWVITDEPYLAFLAGRMVPPPLVDPSDARIDGGLLTSDQAIAAFRDYDVDVVVLWTGKLSRLDKFVQTVSDEQALVAQVGTGNDDYPRLIFHDPDGD